MKIEDVQKLTPDEIRVRVAELRGWTYEGNGTWRDPDGVSCQALYPTGSGFGKIVGFGEYDDEEVPPNYPYDLNAMNEVEEHIASVSRTDWYANDLIRVMGGARKVSNFDLLHATARQRAEAFVLVMENELTFASK